MTKNNFFNQNISISISLYDITSLNLKLIQIDYAYFLKIIFPIDKRVYETILVKFRKKAKEGGVLKAFSRKSVKLSRCLRSCN